MPKISTLGQKLWPTCREPTHTQTHRHTDTHTAHTHTHTDTHIPSLTGSPHEVDGEGSTEWKRRKKGGGRGGGKNGHFNNWIYDLTFPVFFLSRGVIWLWFENVNDFHFLLSPPTSESHLDSRTHGLLLSAIVILVLAWFIHFFMFLFSRNCCNKTVWL